MMFKERREVKAEVTFAGGDPIIYVTPMALDKMAWYVQGCDKEIGWLGRVERLENNIFVIHDVYLFKQEVHATTCEINPEGLADFVTELFTNDTENAMEIVNNLRLWGHSHVNMSVSPSGQDETQVNTFKEANPWFIRVIANKSGEMEFSIFDWEQGIKFKNVKWVEYRANQTALEETIKAEIASKVTTKSYASAGTSWNAGRVWNSTTYKWEDAKPEATSKKNTKVEEYGKARRGSYHYLDGYYDMDEEENLYTPLTSINKADKLYLKCKGGWQIIDRDAKGEIPESFIIENFTMTDLATIAKCKNSVEAHLLIEELDVVNEYNSLDAMNIYDCAQNVYPQ